MTMEEHCPHGSGNARSGRQPYQRMRPMPTRHPTRHFLQCTVEELAGSCITDIKATGYDPCECQLCGRMIEGTVYRVTIFQDGKPSFDIYVDGACCMTELRPRCEISEFVKIMGA